MSLGHGVTESRGHYVMGSQGHEVSELDLSLRHQHDNPAQELLPGHVVTGSCFTGSSKVGIVGSWGHG